MSLNWRGRPLESLQVIHRLIGSTTTSAGLKVYAHLDPGHYEKGIRVTDAELAVVNIARDEFHPDWNYTIHPTPPAAVNYFVVLRRSTSTHQRGPRKHGAARSPP